MYRNIRIIILVGYLLPLFCNSCDKESGIVNERNQISVSVIDDMLDFSTKAFAQVESVPDVIHITATSGQAGVSESEHFTNVAFEKDIDGKYRAKKFWNDIASLNFYALNIDRVPVIGSTAPTLSVSTEEGDIISACVKPVSSGSVAAMHFRHVFAWLYDVRLKTKGTDATATVSKIIIKWPQSGTIDLATAQFISSDSQSSEEIDEVPSIGNTLTSIGQEKVSRLCVPEKVNIEIYYTISYPDGYTQDLSKKGEVTLTQGKKNVITAELDDSHSQTSFHSAPLSWTGVFEATK